MTDKRMMDHEIVASKSYRGSWIKIRKLNEGSYDWEIDLVDVHSDPTVASSPEAAMRWAIKHIDDYLDVYTPEQVAGFQIGKATQLAEDSFTDDSMEWKTVGDWLLRTMDTIGVEHFKSNKGEDSPFQFDLPVREYILYTWTQASGNKAGFVVLRREWQSVFTMKSRETKSELHSWWAIVNDKGLYLHNSWAIEKDDGANWFEFAEFGMNNCAPAHCRWGKVQDAIDFWINNRHLIDANIYERVCRVYGKKAEDNG